MKVSNVHIASGASPRTQDSLILVDGKPLEGVTNVTITGKPNDVWRAVIDVMPQGVQMTGLQSDSVTVRTVALVCPLCHSLMQWSQALHGIAPPLCPHGGGAPADPEPEVVTIEPAPVAPPEKGNGGGRGKTP